MDIEYLYRGLMDAPKLQSAMQLGVALSLTFALAGPALRAMIMSQLELLSSFRDMLKGSHHENLVQATERYIRVVEKNTAHPNPHRMTAFSIAALTFLLGLMWCTHAEKIWVPAAIFFWALLFIVALGDAWDILHRVRHLKKVVTSVIKIGGTYKGDISHQLPVTPSKAATNALNDASKDFKAGGAVLERELKLQIKRL